MASTLFLGQFNSEVRYVAEDRRGARSGGRSSAGGGRSQGAPGRGGKPPSKGGARGGQQGRRTDWKRPEGQRDIPRTVEQSVYDGPELPADITGGELDRAVTAQLKGLPEKLAARVARHLAAADMLVDEDPETAYQHTLAARARAPRRTAYGRTRAQSNRIIDAAARASICLSSRYRAGRRL